MVLSKPLFAMLLLNVAIVAVLADPHPMNCPDFNIWKYKHRQYFPTTDYENFRKTVFAENCKKIAYHNSNYDRTYEASYNHLTILTKDEFETMYLGAIPDPIESISGAIMVDSGRPTDINDIIIPDVDWLQYGVVTPVRNQGYCGSCWAFSAAASIEGYFAIQKGVFTQLSVQQLVDCYRAYSGGCNGGSVGGAINYVQNYGAVIEGVYPYVAVNQPCLMPKGEYKIASVYRGRGCAALLSMIKNGPVSVVVNASNWGIYATGVFNDCITSVNHAVLLVAVTPTYWKIKNSWGPRWGENGFIRIAMGNTCGVCTAGTMPYPFS